MYMYGCVCGSLTVFEVTPECLDIPLSILVRRPYKDLFLRKPSVNTLLIRLIALMNIHRMLKSANFTILRLQFSFHPPFVVYFLKTFVQPLKGSNGQV